MSEEKSGYDSELNTLRHIYRVRTFLLRVATCLVQRADEHDRTKLEEPEKSFYDRSTSRLEETTYKLEEYEKFLDELDEALQHHYNEYRHHPEHFEDGIQDMHLLDLLEMVVDWRAATERHHDGDIRESIEQNQERFGYSDELKRIFHNTADFIEEEIV